MDVRGVGPAIFGTSLPLGQGNAARTAAAEIAELTHDLAAALLQDLTVADLAKLSAVLAFPQGAPDLQPTAIPVEMFPLTLPASAAARPAELIQEAIAAAARGDRAQAIDRLTEFAALQPLKVEALRAAPEMAPIRPEVEQLVARLTPVAKLDASTRLERAEQLTQASNTDRLLDWDARPEALLQIGHRLVEAGGHDNFVRAAQVAQVLIDIYETAPVAFSPANRAGRTGPPPGGDALSWGMTGALRRALGQSLPRIQNLWARAPLLVLLLGWFAAGAAGGAALLLLRALADVYPAEIESLAADLWGLGLLALVAFGFYMRVRKIRF